MAGEGLVEKSGWGCNKGARLLRVPFKRANVQSFTSLVENVRDRLYRLALRMTGDGSEAEDVVQEVLLSGWKQQEEIVGLDNPPAWLLRMTHNRAIDRLRSRKARTRYESAAAPADHHLQTPHRLVESRDTLEQIDRQMAKLSPEQRTVLQLREVEGLSYREIVEATGLTLDQVKVYLHRGRRQLRRLLLEKKIIER
ncbi:RNA polymerase sigma factor [Neolewinella litorea]|uniref:RNA polymerase sigma factor n=1 Tax=Neolewinella litorea TaxID=2562452 RepID=A0A4S4NSZ7_9BACT|nr:RNA polymerase sigma factor [Neolewinella litorea]